MNIERRYRNSRRLYLEYPVFSGDEDECTLPNLFSEKLTEAVAGSANPDAHRTYRLSFSEEANGDEITVRYTLKISESRKTLCVKEASIVWKDGYAVKYEKLSSKG